MNKKEEMKKRGRKEGRQRDKRKKGKDKKSSWWLNMVAHTYNISIREMRQKDQVFKISFVYIESLTST